MKLDIDLIKKINREDCLNFEKFDSEYNIETASPKSISKDGLNQIVPSWNDNRKNVEDSEGYQPTALYWLDVVNDYFKKNIQPDKYTFVDVGAGKGKAILYNILKKAIYKNYVAIEADENLLNIFKNNIKKTFIQINKNISLNLINAKDYFYKGNDHIYFLFYPFSKKVFKEIMDKNLNNLIGTNAYLVFIFEQDYYVQDVVGFPPDFVLGAVSIYKFEQ